MSKRGPISSTSLFAKRGDPWLTEKEAHKDFGRVPVFENPDLDQFTKATKAQHDPAKVTLVGKAKRPDHHRAKTPQERLTSILYGMNDRLHRAKRVSIREDTRGKKNTDEPDFKPPAHHIGVDLLGRDVKTAQAVAKAKGKRRRKNKRK